MKPEFLLAPEIAYLNHGSFGACPRTVFEAYQDYQRELELEPVNFLQRHFPEKMQLARVKLADFLHCHADQVTFVRNATYGMNLVARSLPIGNGDTILTTDHEYGAVDRMWEALCSETGAKLKRVQIPLPVKCSQDLIDAIVEQQRGGDGRRTIRADVAVDQEDRASCSSRTDVRANFAIMFVRQNRERRSILRLNAHILDVFRVGPKRTPRLADVDEVRDASRIRG